jgi:hypothetical protein
MDQTVSTIISIVVVAAYVLAVISVLSTLLFLVGLYRFIRYERRLAKNWNWLREHREELGKGNSRSVNVVRKRHSKPNEMAQKSPGMI